MRKLHLITLILILLVGLFFRSYQAVERFEFAHDGDLYSWIVKDIVVNHHFRLIGQLTSAPGIFIGPLFYYLLVPFFLLTKMDPIGTLIPATMLGILTIFSFYFVLSKLFNKQSGLIAAFLYAILLPTVTADRWVVPTITTSIWAIWYLYSTVLLSRGKFYVLALLGLLVGLIWDVHIALVPSLLAIPIALLLSKKLPDKKNIFLFFIILLISLFPFIFFETRHHFQQTKALMENFLTPQPGNWGREKFISVLQMNIKNINALFFSPQSFLFTQNIFFLILILICPLVLIRQKFISLKDILPLYGWVAGILLFFSISRAPISEYYFSSLTIIFISFVGLFLSFIVKQNRFFSLIVLTLLIFVSFKNAYFIVNESYYNKGYLEKKGVVNFIAKDSFEKGFPCIGISYITAPGENVGFRYLFWLKKIHLVHPSLDVPVYNIVLPDELSNEPKQKFGHIGVIVPAKILPKQTIQKSCQQTDTNSTDPMFGYVD